MALGLAAEPPFLHRATATAKFCLERARPVGMATAGLEYADLEIDFADAALIWLAELIGEYQILTVDRRDFSVFRLKGRKRFDLVRWYSK